MSQHDYSELRFYKTGNERVAVIPRDQWALLLFHHSKTIIEIKDNFYKFLVIEGGEKNFELVFDVSKSLSLFVRAATTLAESELKALIKQYNKKKTIFVKPLPASDRYELCKDGEVGVFELYDKCVAVIGTNKERVDKLHEEIIKGEKKKMKKPSGEVVHMNEAYWNFALKVWPAILSDADVRLNAGTVSVTFRGKHKLVLSSTLTHLKGLLKKTKFEVDAASASDLTKTQESSDFHFTITSDKKHAVYVGRDDDTKAVEKIFLFKKMERPPIPPKPADAKESRGVGIPMSGSDSRQDPESQSSDSTTAVKTILPAKDDHVTTRKELELSYHRISGSKQHTMNDPTNPVDTSSGNNDNTTYHKKKTKGMTQTLTSSSTSFESSTSQLRPQGTNRNPVSTIEVPQKALQGKSEHQLSVSSSERKKCNVGLDEKHKGTTLLGDDDPHTLASVDPTSSRTSNQQVKEDKGDKAEASADRMPNESRETSQSSCRRIKSHTQQKHELKRTSSLDVSAFVPTFISNSSAVNQVKKIYYSKNANVYLFIVEGSITEIKTDAIVNAANERMDHIAGIAGAISKAAGSKLSEECRHHVKDQGPVLVTKTFVSSGYSLPCKQVIHSVGPNAEDYDKMENCLLDLHQTFVNCLNEADETHCSSVAIPAISSGIFGVSVDRVANSLHSALIEVLPKLSHLKSIIIIDINRQFLKKIIVYIAMESGLLKVDMPVDPRVESSDTTDIWQKRLTKSKGGVTSHMTFEKMKCKLDCPKCDHVHKITYEVPAGKQKDGHPNPGKPYKAEKRVAFLPDIPEGRALIELLKTANQCGHIFTIGKSVKRDEDDVVIWDDIPHKTELKDNSKGYGYPDGEYLNTLRKALKEKGIIESMTTDPK